MATIIEFAVDSDGITRLIREAERAEKLERSRAKIVSDTKTTQKQGLTLQEKQIVAIQKEFAERKKNLAALEKSQKKQAALLLKEEKKKQAAERAQTNEKRKQAALRKKEYNDTKKLLRGDLSGIFEGMGARGAILGTALSIGAAALAGLAAAAGYVAAISIDSARAKKSAKGMLEVLGSMDPKSIDKVDQLAKNLGVSIEETRSRFVDFRKEGLSNLEAVELIKTLADVRAKWGEATEAATLDKFFKNLSEGYKYADALGAIRDQLDVVGDGALSAAEGLGKWDQLMIRMGNWWTEAKEAMGGSLLEMMDSFAAFVPFLETQLNKPVLEAFEDLGSALSEGLNLIFPGFSSALDAFNVKLGKGMYKLINDLIPKWIQGGKDLISGFVSGIGNGAKLAVEKVTDVAGNITKKFKNVLGIRSPSIVFEKIGANTIEGLNRGVEKVGRKSPETIAKVADRMVEATPLQLPRGSSGPPSLSVTIENINVANGGDPESTARSIRREIEIMLESIMIQRGIA